MRRRYALCTGCITRGGERPWRAFKVDDEFGRLARDDLDFLGVDRFVAGNLGNADSKEVRNTERAHVSAVSSELHASARLTPDGFGRG